MLQDLIGVRLTLLAGPGIPRPLPAPLMARLVSAEVAISDREVSGFELVFDAIRAAALAGLYPIMAEPALRPGARVVMTATLGILPAVLMDGIIETAEFRPPQSGSSARLHLRGKDLSFAMDREERETSHPAQGPGEIAMMLPFLRRHVELVQPDMLVLMGNTPCIALLNQQGILKLRGTWTEAFGLPALPMTHPAYLLRTPLAKREAWADLLSLSARLDGGKAP